MPKANKQTNDKIIEKEQKTNTGIYLKAGEIESSDYDDKEWTELQADYYKMRNSDALLTTTIDIVKYPILMSEYKIICKNKEVEEYVYWVLDNIEKGFQYYKYHKLLAIDFGLSMHEMIIKRGDKSPAGKLTNRPIYFNPIQNETIHKFYYNDQSQFIGIQHEKRVPEKMIEYIDIDLESLDYYSYNEEFNDIRGRALYRPIRIFWDSKHKILASKVISTQRGTGFPVIYTKGEPSESMKANVEKIGRTIAALRNGYMAANEDKIRIELLSLQNQQDIIPLLEYLDRQMFYNTLSQFVTSGIGANGSRASTSEHKSAYELFANYILQSFETNLQGLVNKIIDMSYFKLQPGEQPVFKLNSISSIDLNKVAENIKKLGEAGLIVKTPEDEKYLREIFGMPKITVNTDNVEKNDDSNVVENVEKLSKKLTKQDRKISLEALQFENKVFELSSALDHYETMQEKTAKLIDSITADFFNDIKSQLSVNRKKSILIKNSSIQLATDKLLDLYDEGYSRGIRDVNIELKKIGINDNKKLAVNKSTNKKRNLIEKLVNRFYFNVKTKIENKMEKIPDEYIEKKGGLNEYLIAFETGFKNEKNSIKQELEGGYIDGRGETLETLGDQVTYFYSARLDRSLCDSCAPYDGLILTFDELKDTGLTLSHPVNPDCLGENNCRCLFIAYDYGRGEDKGVSQ